MGAQQSLQRYQDRRTLEAAAEGRLDGIAVSRDLFEARGLGLIGLPSGLVARMSDVSTVDVSENRFETLPAQICTLSGVKTFLAHDNSLRELPRAFGDLFSLEHLDLSRNALAGSLPPMVGSLKQLRELRLQQNKLTELPDNIGDLVRLERLALDHNNLDSLPSSFTTLTSLRDLGISYNVLTSTHEHLDRLTALTRLDLAFNRLTAVPSLEQLTALRTLALESNRLREGAGAAAARVAERAAAAAAADAEVDGELLVDPVHDPRVARVRAGAKVGGRVVTSHQIVVGLASAGSASKEDWAPIDQLRRAQQLATQLSRQQMARMDDEAEEEGVGGGAPSLEAVTAATRARAMSSAREQSAAARRSVPDSARAAPPGGAAGRGEGADDDGDEDDDIDSSQVQLPRLVTLGLSKAGLRHLPAAFGSFASLTALDLSNNRHLKSLPEGLCKGMPRLDTLLLRGCALESLPTSLGRLSSLTCLHVQLNKLTVLPPSLGRLRQLTELDASGNAKLIDLPEQLAQGCVRLRVLRLGECSALRIPDNLGDAGALEEITVAARQVAVAPIAVREVLESGRVRVTLS
ncbi:hypothetical protein FNF28_07119 [Cafeteria roenbergensis]|uniref:Disease resistance R13L4/SHOC-2-like LRR domain-containing protein n=1 Tax=Cafeteria roenbergensis TaxID=33653 RepID=A0A5A8CGF5_CAFRO|nr:hypothetical protein FNF28_07119 [Cafeteria roenbergensis]